MNTHQWQGQVFAITAGKRAGASIASMPALGDQEYVSIVGRSGDARHANKFNSEMNALVMWYVTMRSIFVAALAAGWSALTQGDATC